MSHISYAPLVFSEKTTTLTSILSLGKLFGGISLCSKEQWGESTFSAPQKLAQDNSFVDKVKGFYTNSFNILRRVKVLEQDNLLWSLSVEIVPFLSWIAQGVDCVRGEFLCDMVAGNQIRAFQGTSIAQG